MLFRSIVGDLRKKQLQRLKPKFNTDDAALDREIARMMGEIYKDLTICEKNLKNIIQSEFYKKPIENTSKFIDIIVQTNIKQVLAQKIQEITKKFRKQEKEYYIRRKEIEGDEGGVIKNPLIENNQFNNEDQMELESMEEVAYSRDAQINNIVQSINDLAVLFKELSVLVVDQGNILDRIDYNIEQAVRHTKKANTELRKVNIKKYIRVKRVRRHELDRVLHAWLCP